MHIDSESPAEFSSLINAFMELRSNVNLPCLVNLAQFIFRLLLECLLDLELSKVWLYGIPMKGHKYLSFIKIS